MSLQNRKMKLKVAPNSNALHPNIELLDLRPPTRRFVGWQMKSVQIDGEQRIAFDKKEDADVVSFNNDYVKAVQQGDLIPADKETAAMCGVSWSEPQAEKKSDEKTSIKQ